MAKTQRMMVALPLAEIALPPPELQIRAIHPEWIAQLTETDPDE
jgi:hypothetical protein